MSIEKSITRIQDDIKYQTERLSLYIEMSRVFKNIEFPEGMNIWFNRYVSGRTCAEFSPGYSDDASKDLQPFVHALTRRFRVKFTKEQNYEKTALTYHADVEYKTRDGEVKKLSINVNGVVPKSCHIEETEIPLTEEEIEEARRQALESVKTVRVEKKIVCK